MNWFKRRMPRGRLESDIQIASTTERRIMATPLSNGRIVVMIVNNDGLPAGGWVGEPKMVETLVRINMDRDEFSRWLDEMQVWMKDLRAGHFDKYLTDPAIFERKSVR